MIQALRTRHRRMITALWLILPTMFVFALANRAPLPTVAELPFENKQPRVASVVETVDWLTLPMDLEIVVLENDAPGIRIAPREDLKRPEILVYWRPSSATASPTDVLPDDAILLGALSGTEPQTFGLDAEKPGEGRVYLYSLAHAEVIDSVVVTVGGAR